MTSFHWVSAEYHTHLSFLFNLTQPLPDKIFKFRRKNILKNFVSTKTYTLDIYSIAIILGKIPLFLFEGSKLQVSWGHNILNINIVWKCTVHYIFYSGNLWEKMVGIGEKGMN